MRLNCPSCDKQGQIMELAKGYVTFFCPSCGCIKDLQFRDVVMELPLNQFSKYKSRRGHQSHMEEWLCSDEGREILEKIGAKNLPLESVAMMLGCSRQTLYRVAKKDAKTRAILNIRKRKKTSEASE